jgi:serine phosphatase RsbU (regulator of sigma subunit)
LGSEEVTFKTRKIYVGGSELPVNSDGEILVNYSNPADYYKKSMKLGGLLAKAERGESFESIESGDTVLILSSMYTGAAKFIPTPVGQLPSAYINATLLSSRIEGNWLDTHELRMPYILLGAFFALLLMRLSGVLLWTVSGGIMVIWTVCVSYFFVFHSVLIDLISPILTYITTAFVAFMFKSHVYEKVSLFFKIVLAEKTRLQFEVDQADGIAKGFRPLPPPKFEGIEISYTHRSLSASSGDWFAFEKSKSGRYLHFIMCDVTGHGLQASIVVSTCKATLTIVSNAFQDLTEGFDFLPTYIEQLNLALFKGGAGQHVTTLTAITFDRDTNHTKYFTAGHPNPFHLLPKDDGLKFGKISTASNPLGLRSKVETEGMDVFFRPGESLVFFTDGVPFPRNAKKNPELFDSKFATDLPSRVQNVLDHLLIEHSKKTGVGQDDDISLVWFQREPREADEDQKNPDRALAQ